ncbi:UNVERIFIED_CONTAM: hypothetical protein GTU68_033855 [Idotea baltica]|nr:hypothetical protein [Idotea baltica]
MAPIALRWLWLDLAKTRCRSRWRTVS